MSWPLERTLSKVSGRRQRYRTELKLKRQNNRLQQYTAITYLDTKAKIKLKTQDKLKTLPGNNVVLIKSLYFPWKSSKIINLLCANLTVFISVFSSIGIWFNLITSIILHTIHRSNLQLSFVLVEGYWSDA